MSVRFPISSHPILTAAAAKTFEAEYFGGDADAEWRAMQRAGNAVGESIWRDFGEFGAWPSQAAILVLAGKGHNAGDALIAAQRLLRELPRATVEVAFVFPSGELRPLVQKAYRELVQFAAGRVSSVRIGDVVEKHYSAWIDGVFGYQFHPPLDARLKGQFETIARTRVDFRAAVDLPSGLGDPAALRADVSYATGILKAELTEPAHREAAGRIRYLDLGFFDEEKTATPNKLRVLAPSMLRELGCLRSATSDKRTYGHLLVVGGSRRFPGAIMMSVRAALRTGVGLLTAVVPESLVPAYAAHVPEAMWVGCPETPNGGLALEGIGLIREVSGRATALAMGPGLAREAETLALIRDILQEVDRPVVLDADALQVDIVSRGRQQKIVTPHAGEFKRLAGETSLSDYVRETGLICVEKGAPTRIAQADTTYISAMGGPVLARGGSGDMLAGMIGGLLAQDPGYPLEAACCGVLWHGMAADCWARRRGAVAVQSTELLDFLAVALREGDAS
ncbi:MAG TPA: NAD(P)H-hydrate dehydratase [Opitutaceae bacterium]|nr:NAD(P)H-hydrate dehydratase [Opitutaceae bacterium]